jgi:hypothetical protein
MSKISIKNVLNVDDECTLGNVFIDDVEVMGVTSVHISMGVDQLPKMSICILPDEIEIDGELVVEIKKED